MNTKLLFSYLGRSLEARTVVSAGEWQVRIYENGAFYTYSVLAYAPLESAQQLSDRIGNELQRARADIESGFITLPQFVLGRLSVPTELS